MNLNQPILALGGHCAGLVALAAPSPAAVILDQIGDPESFRTTLVDGSRPSQVFTDYPDFSSMVIDDFAVEAPQVGISQVSALVRAVSGFSGFSLVDGWRLSVFSDPVLAGEGLSGDVADLTFGASEGVTIQQVGDGDHALVTLTTFLLLPDVGFYWVGISAIASESPAGQFLILANGMPDVEGEPPVEMSGNGYFANPQGGFGVGKLTSTEDRYAYRVIMIPEASMALLCLAGGVFVFGRRGRENAGSFARAGRGGSIC